MRSLIKFRKRPRVVQIGSLPGEVVEEEEVEKMALGGRLKALDVAWMTEVKVPVAEAVVVLLERLVGKLEAEVGKNIIVSAEALGMDFFSYF